MSTAAVTLPVSAAATAATTTSTPAAVSGFKRFIDDIGAFFKKAEPVASELAVAAEPVLALTPFGPEYDLVVNAIVGVQKTATASLAAGTAITSTQKMSLVLQAVTPGLTTILASAGITETAAQQTAIAQFAQNVYNLQTGPSVVVASTTSAGAAPATAA